MLTLRRIAPLCVFGLLAACGQPEGEQALPQNEALENAPQGIIVVDENTPLPPDFVIQTLTTAEQASMLSTVNATRTRGTSCGGTAYGAAPALKSNAKLINAAEGHGADMAKNNYFSHTGLDGSTPGTRITKAMYSWSAYGENIAAGRTTIADTVKDWYGSTGHCINFMSKTVTEAGFGKGYSATSTYKNYWVAVMAKPK
jgi:uncharacterized protein YkwD